MDISILKWELDIIGNVGNSKVYRKIWLPRVHDVDDPQKIILYLPWFV